jgi:hypothetical protein
MTEPCSFYLAYLKFSWLYTEWFPNQTYPFLIQKDPWFSSQWRHTYLDNFSFGFTGNLLKIHLPLFQIIKIYQAVHEKCGQYICEDTLIAASVTIVVLVCGATHVTFFCLQVFSDDHYNMLIHDLFSWFSVSKAKLSEYSEKIEALAATLAAPVVCVCDVDSYLYWYAEFLYPCPVELNTTTSS